MKKALLALLALCLLMTLPALAEYEGETPVSADVEAGVGLALTAGEDNGLSVEGGEALPAAEEPEELPVAWSEEDGETAEEDGETVVAAGAVEEFDLPAPVEDEPAGVPGYFEGGEAVVEFDGSGLDSDALFAGYANRLFYDTSRVLRASRTAGQQLSGAQAELYEILKANVIEVAAGSRASTIFEVPLSAFLGNTRFTAKELGVTVQYNSQGQITADSLTAMQDAYRQLFLTNIGPASTALWMDCPYELYWFDRYNSGVRFSYPGAYTAYDEAAGEYYLYTADSAVANVYFKVVAPYQGSDENTVDASKLSRATTAAQNAKNIAVKYAGYSDYAKLYGLALEICRLVTYNDAAANETSTYILTDQDPWKLIYVFDGDPNTNVVCEGYSLAYRYLCELSSFDAGVECYLVTGTAGGAHAWNLVSMDGKNYVVDVTWMDGEGVDSLSGAMPQWINDEKGGLFMAGAGKGSVSAGYTIDYRTSSRTTQRTYNSETTSIFPQSVLRLAASKYVPDGLMRIDGKTYYYKNGKLQTGSVTLDGANYEFGSDGALTGSWTTGWHTINGEKVYMDENGLHTQHTGGKADCEHGAVCTVCGVEYGAALGHSYTARTVAADCENAGYIEHTCARCGDSYKSAQKPALGHTGGTATCTEKAVCTRCKQPYGSALGHAYNSVKTAPTCTEKGYTTHTCSRCTNSYRDAETAALGHTGGAATCTEKAVCTRCKQPYGSALGHSLTALTTAPTCTERGYTTHSCYRCDYSYVDSYVNALGHTGGTATCTERAECIRCDQPYGEPLGHRYSAEKTEPTCTERGYTTHTCDRCLDRYVDGYVPALGHTGGKATCTEGPECDRCHSNYGSALGHAYNSVKTAPTCTAKGYTTHTCSRCKDSYRDAETAALGHAYSAAVTAPSCTAGGYTTHTCSRCGDSYVDSPVNALGHAYNVAAIAPTCTEYGYTAHVCARCGDSYADGLVEPLGHTGGQATCTAGAICERCGASYGGGLGHAYAGRVVPPTCTESGYTAYSCLRCGDSFNGDFTGPAGHVPVVSPAVAPTLTTVGWTEESYCGVCGAKLAERQTLPMLDRLTVTAGGEFGTSYGGGALTVGRVFTINIEGATIKTCKSSNSKVLKITKKGKVTAKKAGSAKLTITTKDKKKMVLRLKVTDPYAARKISVAEGKKLTLKAGDALRLTAVTDPGTAAAKLKWKSSAKGVAAVSSDGVVTAKKPGTAKITVTTSNKKKVTVTVKVVK